MQLESESVHDFEDCPEFGTSIPGERFVETLPGEPCVTGDLAHSFGSSDIPKRFRDQSRVAIHLFYGCLQIGRHLFRIAEN